MDLARHSDPKLTLRTYAKVTMHNLARVLDGLPKANATPTSERQTLRATGTDDATSGMETGPQKGPHSGPHSQHDSVRVSAAWRDQREHFGERRGGSQSLAIAGASDAVRHGAASSGQVGDKGFEPLLSESESLANAGNKGLAAYDPHSGPHFAGAAEHPALAPDAAPDPDLVAVVAAWPTLALALRAGVLALVRVGLTSGNGSDHPPTPPAGRGTSTQGGRR
jgi:hypothetical protein